MSIEGKFLQEDLQRIRGFRLMDDDFMSKCFEDYACVELVLRIILEKEDIKVEQVRTQYKIKNLQGRSIILDIYATDKSGKRYNIEIQRADHGAGAKRARYHSSLMDADITEPGEKLENLEETYVVFITENDVLGKGLPLYHIDRVIAETGTLFGDEAHILYVNGAYRDDSPVGKLMHDFSCTEPEEMHYKPLEERTRYFKENEEGVGSMCRDMEKMRNEAASKAAKEAKQEERKRILKNLLVMGISIEEAAKAVGLSVAEAETMASNIER